MTLEGGPIVSQHYVIRCVGRRCLELSKQDDGSYLLQVVLVHDGGVQILANLVLEPSQALALRTALKAAGA